MLTFASQCDTMLNGPDESQECLFDGTARLQLSFFVSCTCENERHDLLDVSLNEAGSQCFRVCFYKQKSAPRQ